VTVRKVVDEVIGQVGGVSDPHDIQRIDPTLTVVSV